MRKEIKPVIISFITNFLLSIIKILTGLIGKSNALIVDGIHSISDLTTDVIAIFGSHMARKPADIKHPYGHGKSEYVTSLIIGIIIIILGFGIIKDLGNKGANVPSLLVGIIAFVTIIVKIFLSRYLISKGNLYSDTILVARGFESKTDVITSIIVLVSTFLSNLSKYFDYLKYTDKVAALLVAIFIVRTGYNIVKDNISYIIGEQVRSDNYLFALKKIILDDSLVINNLIILKYGPYSKLLAEIALDGNISLKEAHDKIDEIEYKIKEYDSRILYINIHMCPK